MLPLWHLMVELSGRSTNSSKPPKVGYMNVLLRAETAASAQQKLSIYCNDLVWSLVEGELATMIGLDFIAEEDEPSLQAH